MIKLKEVLRFYMVKDINTDSNELQQRCINAIRVLSMDAVERASSGHPGAPMESWTGLFKGPWRASPEA